MAQIDFGGINKVADTLPGPGWTLSATTGTMAAALGSAGNVFIMRASTVSTNAKAALITRMRLQFTTITAFTTPVTAGRRLALYRTAHPSGTTAGGYANPSANNTTVVPVACNTADTSSVFTQVAADPEWATAEIATTASMTIGAGLTVETNPLRVWNLSHVGAAGGNDSVEWTFSPPIFLARGTGLIIRPPAAMDAAGTWHLAVAVDWQEVGTMT